ncbi:MAG: RsiV family protein [Candidatus Symbiothrix sp.]|jgi:hypothetical protein|nr:RsiV family protein [Candidatus Symbiothrix sp.]
MRKINILFCSLITIFACTCFACTFKKGESEKAKVRFTTIRTDSVLFGGLYVEFTYPDSADDASLESLQRIFMEKTFGEAFVGLSPQQALDTCAAEYFQFLNDAKQDNDNSVPISAYYNRISNIVVLNGSRFISSVVYSEGYFGGAHGWKEITGFVIDLATGKLLTENDFAGEKYEQNMSDVLVRKIMEKNAVTTEMELENLGYDVSVIRPNGNFSIDNHGLTYYFNEYEIAPYSLGGTKITIPYEELEIYILSNSPLTTLIYK